MLRITEYIRDTLNDKEIRTFNGSILIWNLTNVCNLSCWHCYASANAQPKEELSTEALLEVIPDLQSAGVRFAILSGGEPLIRKDIYQLARALRAEGIHTYLSTNGLLVNEQNIDTIKEHFTYMGISIDGNPDVHDQFRGKKGAYQRSLDAIRLGLDKGIKVGIRFTLTPLTLDSLPHIFELAEQERIPKIYLSHLVYAGRGQELKDLKTAPYRQAVDFIMDKAFEYIDKKTPIDIVTGNNEADAAILLQRFEAKHPELAPKLKQRLQTWGGNQAGTRLVNIDDKGNVKPDPFFPEIVGNIKERRFIEIWNDHPTLNKLREQPRKIGGKCQSCTYLDICNGNSRARSYAAHSNLWQEDPACYLVSA